MVESLHQIDLPEEGLLILWAVTLEGLHSHRYIAVTTYFGLRHIHCIVHDGEGCIHIHPQNKDCYHTQMHTNADLYTQWVVLTQAIMSSTSPNWPSPSFFTNSSSQRGYNQPCNGVQLLPLKDIHHCQLGCRQVTTQYLCVLFLILFPPSDGREGQVFISDTMSGQQLSQVWVGHILQGIQRAVHVWLFCMSDKAHDGWNVALNCQVFSQCARSSKVGSSFH